MPSINTHHYVVEEGTEELLHPSFLILRGHPWDPTEFSLRVNEEPDSAAAGF